MDDAIFVTGLSLGGSATCYFFENKFAEKYLPKVRALVPMSGVELSTQEYNFDFIKKNPIPVWAFCGASDKRIGVKPFFQRLKDNVPYIYTTEYPGGHDGWINQYKTAQYNGLNFLEWCASLIPVQKVVRIERKIENGVEVLRGSAITENCIIEDQYGGVSRYIVQ